MADRLVCDTEPCAPWHGLAGIADVQAVLCSPSCSKTACFTSSILLSGLKHTVTVLPVSVLTNSCGPSGPEQAVAWQHGGFQGGQLAWHSAQRCYQLRQGHGTRAHARSLQSTGLQACRSSMAPNSLQAYYSQTTPNSIAPACNWQVWQLGKEAVAGNGLVSLPQHSFATRVPQAHFSGRASQHWRDVGGHMRAASRLGHWKHHVAAVGQANGDLPGREQCRSSET